MEKVDRNEELYNSYESLFTEDIVKITQKYFESVRSTRLSSIYEKKMSQSMTLKKLKFKSIISFGELNSLVDIDIGMETDDGGFVFKLVKVYDDYEKDIQETIIGKLESTENHVLTFRYANIIPKCKVRYERDYDVLDEINVIIISIVFTEEDIST